MGYFRFILSDSFKTYLSVYLLHYQFASVDFYYKTYQFLPPARTEPKLTYVHQTLHRLLHVFMYHSPDLQNKFLNMHSLAKENGPSQKWQNMCFCNGL